MNKYVINESAHYSDVAVQKRNTNSIEFIAILQEADSKNRNGRIYPKAVLVEALNSPYIRERLATNSWYGEANHPADQSVQRQLTVDLSNVAFLIKEYWWEGNYLKARCETANTSIGRDMMGLIEQGSKVAFSLRAQGNVHRDPITGDTIVEPGMQICTYDWVLQPSHQAAYLQTVCEATMYAMLGRFGQGAMALCEATNLFENGELIDMEKTVELKTIDYTKSYTPNLKPLREMYIPHEKDELVSIEEGVVTVKSEVDNALKKIVVEDYLVKDIRDRISKL